MVANNSTPMEGTTMTRTTTTKLPIGECGCTVDVMSHDGTIATPRRIDYCSTHARASAMLELLKYYIDAQTSTAPTPLEFEARAILRAVEG
jgi:hypothetical protein